jgi:hypothetical protein
VLLALVSKALARYGLSKLAQAVIKGLIAKGETSQSIRKKISSIPKWIVSTRLRSKIENVLQEATVTTSV